MKPGNARIKAGSPLAIEARLVGNRRRSSRSCRSRTAIAGASPTWRATSGAFTLAMPSVHRRIQVPRRRRRGDVADLRDRRRAPAARDAHRRRLHLSRRAEAAAADRDRQRRHLCAGRHRCPRAHLHRSSGGQRPAWRWPTASRSRSTRRRADRAHRVAEGDRRSIVPRGARRSRRHGDRRRHRVFHPHARGSSAGSAHPEAGHRSRR